MDTAFKLNRLQGQFCATFKSHTHTHLCMHAPTHVRHQMWTVKIGTAFGSHQAAKCCWTETGVCFSLTTGKKKQKIHTNTNSLRCETWQHLRGKKTTTAAQADWIILEFFLGHMESAGPSGPPHETTTQHCSLLCQKTLSTGWWSCSFIPLFKLPTKTKRNPNSLVQILRPGPSVWRTADSKQLQRNSEVTRSELHTCPGLHLCSSACSSVIVVLVSVGAAFTILDDDRPLLSSAQIPEILLVNEGVPSLSPISSVFSSPSLSISEIPCCSSSRLTADRQNTQFSVQA